MPKLDGSLNKIYSGWTENPEGAISIATDLGLDIKNGFVLVTIITLDENEALKVRNTINNKFDGEILANYEELIDAWIPIRALEVLSNQPGVSFVQQPIKTIPL